MDVKLAPEPFPSADIYLAGPERCRLMWMQILKVDAVHCRKGDRIEAKGVVTSDPESKAWQINPERNEYMRLNEDFTCARQNLGAR